MYTNNSKKIYFDYSFTVKKKILTNLPVTITSYFMKLYSAVKTRQIRYINLRILFTGKNIPQMLTMKLPLSYLPIVHTVKIFK